MLSMQACHGAQFDLKFPRSYHYRMQELMPFSPGALSARLFAEMQISGREVHVSFRIDDPQNLIQGAPEETRAWVKQEAVRADGLWKETCFEAFWARPGESAYWELNFSANGKWALYRFDGYRTPYPPVNSTEFGLTRLETSRGAISCVLEAGIPISEWNVSFCSVLKTKDSIHYFSTNHAGEKPDFHLRKSFTLSKGNI